MITLFEYPPNAHFGKVLPKNKIYDRARPSASLKRLFIEQVETITWQYKLAPDTINLPSTKAVEEIQIFHVTLRTGELKDDVLRCIDKAIPFPLLFELHYEGQCKMIATYKRPNEADNLKRVLSEYFATDWIPESNKREPLPVSLNLGVLYQQLLRPLLPYPPMDKETLREHVERIERIRAKERELQQNEARLNKEKQFNRQVPIHSHMREIRREIEVLTNQPNIS